MSLSSASVDQPVFAHWLMLVNEEANTFVDAPPLACTVKNEEERRPKDTRNEVNLSMTWSLDVAAGILTTLIGFTPITGCSDHMNHVRGRCWGSKLSEWQCRAGRDSHRIGILSYHRRVDFRKIELHLGAVHARVGVLIWSNNNIEWSLIHQKVVQIQWLNGRERNWACLGALGCWGQRHDRGGAYLDNKSERRTHWMARAATTTLI